MKEDLGRVIADFFSVISFNRDKIKNGSWWNFGDLKGGININYSLKLLDSLNQNHRFSSASGVKSKCNESIQKIFWINSMLGSSYSCFIRMYVMMSWKTWLADWRTRFIDKFEQPTSIWLWSFYLYHDFPAMSTRYIVLLHLTFWILFALVPELPIIFPDRKYPLYFYYNTFSTQLINVLNFYVVYFLISISFVNKSSL